MRRLSARKTRKGTPPHPARARITSISWVWSGIAPKHHEHHVCWAWANENPFTRNHKPSLPDNSHPPPPPPPPRTPHHQPPIKTPTARPHEVSEHNPTSSPPPESLTHSEVLERGDPAHNPTTSSPQVSERGDPRTRTRPPATISAPSGADASARGEVSECFRACKCM